MPQALISPKVDHTSLCVSLSHLVNWNSAREGQSWRSSTHCCRGAAGKARSRTGLQVGRVCRFRMTRRERRSPHCPAQAGLPVLAGCQRPAAGPFGGASRHRCTHSGGRLNAIPRANCKGRPEAWTFDSEVSSRAGCTGLFLKAYGVP